MDLKKAISVLVAYTDNFHNIAGDAMYEAADSFMETVRVITPLKTGDMSEDWRIVDFNVTSTGASAKVETNPMHYGDNYASTIEAMYRTRVGPGDRNSLDFHRRTEALYKLKADDIIQEYLETSLKQLL